MTIRRSRMVIPPTLPTTAPATIGVLVEGAAGAPVVLLFALPVAEVWPTASETPPPAASVGVLEVDVWKLDKLDDVVEEKRPLEGVDDMSDDVLEVSNGPASKLLAPVEEGVIEFWVELKAGGKTGIKGISEAAVGGP
jgi:hypothetical protein